MRTPRSVAAAIAMTAAGALLAAPAHSAPPSTQACAYLTNYIGERTWPKYTPNRYRGDGDFKGHGPQVHAEAQLHYSTTSTGVTVLTLRIQIDARETTSDWTSAGGAIYHPVFATQAGYEIYSIADSTGRIVVGLDREIHYIDNDHADDVFGPAYATTDHFISFVRSYRIVGDTDGHEAGSRTGVTLTTRWMVVQSRKCTSG